MTDNKVRPGKKVTNFTLPATGDKTLSLNDFKNKKVVVYFYRKTAPQAALQKDRTFVTPKPVSQDKIQSSWAYPVTA